MKKYRVDFTVQSYVILEADDEDELIESLNQLRPDSIFWTDSDHLEITGIKEEKAELMNDENT